MKLSVPSPRGLAVCVAVVLAIFIFAQSTPPAQVTQHENAALTDAVGIQPKSGGKIVLGATRYCDSFDPARSYDQWCGVIFRLYSRNLMAFQGQPGKASMATVPDAAAVVPTVSTDKTTWTFTLRSNVRWSDGKPITASDVKYSIQRLFDPKIIGAVNVSYLCLLTSCPKGVPQYPGPYVRSKIKLASVSISGTRTVRFKLKAPFVDFDRVLALPQFSIVQRDRELALLKRKQTYADNPSSSGPFVITRDKETRSVKFVRNKNWNQQSDPIRNPRVDTFLWRNYRNDILLDRAVLNGDIDIRLGDGLGKEGLETLAKNQTLLKNVDNPYTGYVNYFALSKHIAPMNRIRCREAIFYAVDKSALQNLRGGDRGSSVATSLLPTLLDGYSEMNNRYPSGKDNSGNISAARESLKQCGYPDGFEFSIAYLNAGIGPEIVRSVQTSLARIGVVVVPKPFNTYAKFVAVVQNPDELTTSDISMVISGNSSPISSAYDYWAPIADSRLISAFGNQNLALINSQSIDNTIDQLISSPEQRTDLSAKINDDVMATAQYLPYAYDKQVLYRSPHLANVYVQQALGGHYDLVNMALATK